MENPKLQAPNPKQISNHKLQISNLRFAICRLFGAWSLGFGILLLLAGCQAHQPPNAPTTRPSLATTQPSYWLSLPATSAIEATDFERLWSACEQATWHFGFIPDRLDRRGGVMTSQPLVSKQFFEFWRNDVVTADDLSDSSLATYRRTLRFEIKKLDRPGGGYRATPSVLIERETLAERPITASVYLRQAFRSQRGQRGQRPVGTPETDRGVFLPRQYWTPTGRDTALEKQVAQEAQKRLHPD
jgi:hypothetical protein